MKRWYWLWTLFVVGCTTHIAPYRTKTREFETGEYGTGMKPEVGSLYRGGRGLSEDDRAGRLGDLVVIQIDESDSASHDSSTKLGKKSTSSYGVSGGLISALQKAIPSVDLNKIFGSDSSSTFDGQGQIQRQGKLSAMLPVRVRKILPNDDLYVEGTKVVMVGNEEHHLYISGIVRLADIRGDGSVPSSRVADAEIEYTGRGDASDHQRPGWLTNALNKVSPL